jgi:hypothetical protein
MIRSATPLRERAITGKVDIAVGVSMAAVLYEEYNESHPYTFIIILATTPAYLAGRSWIGYSLLPSHSLYQKSSSVVVH